jgi:hypothetical protein
MPRIRDAILSGWNCSKSSNFSPTPANFTGLPVTASTESAAPPLESPSSFVRITPVIPSASLKLAATLTASWPVMESIVRSISFGSTFSLIPFSSFISSWSMWSRPAVSRITTSKPLSFANFTLSLAIFTGLVCPISKTFAPAFSPTIFNCSIAAGR